ncbi:hypothetical protein [Anaerolentibacter hominis]|uniref:hypothetical protein n=1 Tax=Anaerolentibacter hominis TaxID=3079009 RepID=UPI0031B83A84
MRKQIWIGALSATLILMVPNITTIQIENVKAQECILEEREQFFTVTNNVEPLEEWKQENQFSASLSAEVIEEFTDYAVPRNSSFKSYMSYRAISNKRSKQYKLQMKAETGKYGIRTVDDRYCIALGSYYTTKVGTKVDLIMKNGAVIECILADCKANRHTDKTNRQTADGSVVEFVVDTRNLHRKAKKMGDMSYCSDDFKGRIKEIRVYE